MQVSRQPVRVKRALAVHFRRVQRVGRHSRDPTPAAKTQQCVRRVARASLPLDGGRGGGGGARRARSPDSHSVTTATAEHGNRSPKTMTAVTVITRAGILVQCRIFMVLKNAAQ